MMTRIGDKKMNTRSTIVMLLTVMKRKQSAMKLYALVPFLSVAIAATSINAAVISVDLGTAANAVAGDVTGGFVTGLGTTWNSLPISNNMPPTSTGALTTMDGSLTKNPVIFTLGVAGETISFWRLVGSDLLYKDHVYVRSATTVGSGKTAVSFSFSGLIPGGDYDVKFYSGNNASAATIAGSGPTNVGIFDVGTFSGLAADANGIIAGNFTQQLETHRDASMSGIQIEGDFTTDPAGMVLILK